MESLNAQMSQLFSKVLHSQETETDWDAVMQICEALNAHPELTEPSVKMLASKLKEGSSFMMSLQCLVLLDSLVKNVPKARAVVASSSDTRKALERAANLEEKARKRKKGAEALIERSQDLSELSLVEQKAMRLIQAWGALHPKEFPSYLKLVEKYKVAGVQFPPAESEDLVPVAGVRPAARHAPSSSSSQRSSPLAKPAASPARPTSLHAGARVVPPQSGTGTSPPRPQGSPSASSSRRGDIDQAREAATLLSQFSAQEDESVADIAASLRQTLTGLQSRIAGYIQAAVDSGANEDLLAELFSVSELVENALAGKATPAQPTAAAGAGSDAEFFSIFDNTPRAQPSPGKQPAMPPPAQFAPPAGPPPSYGAAVGMTALPPLQPTTTLYPQMQQPAYVAPQQMLYPPMAPAPVLQMQPPQQQQQQQQQQPSAPMQPGKRDDILDLLMS